MTQIPQMWGRGCGERRRGGRRGGRAARCSGQPALACTGSCGQWRRRMPPPSQSYCTYLATREPLGSLQRFPGKMKYRAVDFEQQHEKNFLARLAGAPDGGTEQLVERLVHAGDAQRGRHMVNRTRSVPCPKLKHHSITRHGSYRPAAVIGGGDISGQPKEKPKCPVY